ncbi:unnamed protein product, partial [Ectocarpus fasciculatus]
HHVWAPARQHTHLIAHVDIQVCVCFAACFVHQRPSLRRATASRQADVEQQYVPVRTAVVLYTRSIFSKTYWLYPILSYSRVYNYMYTAVLLKLTHERMAEIPFARGSY